MKKSFIDFRICPPVTIGGFAFLLCILIGGPVVARAGELEHFDVVSENPASSHARVGSNDALGETAC